MFCYRLAGCRWIGDLHCLQALQHYLDALYSASLSDAVLEDMS